MPTILRLGYCHLQRLQAGTGGDGAGWAQAGKRGRLEGLFKVRDVRFGGPGELEVILA